MVSTDILEIEESIYSVYDELGNKEDMFLLIHNYSQPTSVYDAVVKTFNTPVLVVGVANFGVATATSEREPVLGLSITLPSKVLRDAGLLSETTQKTVLCSRDRVQYKGKQYDIRDVVPKAEYSGVPLLYHITCLDVV